MNEFNIAIIVSILLGILFTFLILTILRDVKN